MLPRTPTNRGHAAGRRDASMSLLAELADTPDPAYATAGDARGARRPAAPPSGPRRAVVLGGLLLTLGLLVGVAVGQTRQRAPAAAQARRALATDVAVRTAAADALERRAAEVRAALTQARNDSLAATTAGAALRERLGRLDRVTGAVAVTGPGVRVVLDDAPGGPAEPGGAASSTGPADTGRVVDRDLQDVVNALWAVGAEAVAINGQRLTSQSAIREAGQAILVDFRPLSPPYRVDAIGDPQRLPARFTDSDSAQRFRGYAASYGLRFEVQPQDALALPAAGTLLLRRARPAAAAPT